MHHRCPLSILVRNTMFDITFSHSISEAGGKPWNQKNRTQKIVRL
jgi:hypothetical protein